MPVLDIVGPLSGTADRARACPHRAMPRCAPVRRAARADAGMERRGRARHRASLRSASRTSCRRSNGRSSRPTSAPSTWKAINALKKERNAVILAHNYQTPEIYHCVADFVGDSLQLAREATKVKADVIVQAGVHFMAETAKILNPDKTVLIPDLRAGCSLASSITAEDVRLLRERFPGVPVVTYVNTSAEVKAESDITCTSSNALQVVESLGVDKVIFVPDQYLAKYVASQTKVKIIAWKGSCEVHERFTGDELALIRANDPSVQIIAHPECPPDVIAASDFTGSTAHMIDGSGCARTSRSASCWSPNARWPTTCRPNCRTWSSRGRATSART